MKSIYYDLEGPITEQDNAFLVCAAKIQDGCKLFEVVSRYVVTHLGAGRYQPGDTLGLIIPFLVEAGVREDDIRRISGEAGLVEGISEFFVELHGEDCPVWIISTSYGQHAYAIAERVGVPPERVYPTLFPLDFLTQEIGTERPELIQEVRERAVGFFRSDVASGSRDREIQDLLGPFYQTMSKTRLGQAMSDIEVIGGQRKKRALQAILSGSDCRFGEVFAVVDSITDRVMAHAVDNAGGIALAWNGNWQVLPWCTCGVAAKDARAVGPLFRAWQEGGRFAVKDFMEAAPEPDDPDGPYYHWLSGEDERFKRDVVLPVHQRLRTACRGKDTAVLI